MKTDELKNLLVAAEVRKLAIELRTHSRAKEQSVWANGYPEIADGPAIAYTKEEQQMAANLESQRQARAKDKTAHLLTWDKNHPLSSFIVEALEELESVAKLITDHQASRKQ